jgi:hypothetical protein
MKQSHIDPDCSHNITGYKDALSVTNKRLKRGELAVAHLDHHKIKMLSSFNFQSCFKILISYLSTDSI